MKRKTRIGHTVPDELETKIINCFKHVLAPSIAKVLGIKQAKVYVTLRKFQIPIKPHSNVEGTKYGVKIEPKKRSNHRERICKPFKTNQIT
jgi:hypothetical protein